MKNKILTIALAIGISAGVYQNVQAQVRPSAQVDLSNGGEGVARMSECQVHGLKILKDLDAHCDKGDDACFDDNLTYASGKIDECCRVTNSDCRL